MGSKGFRFQVPGFRFVAEGITAKNIVSVFKH